MFISLSVFYRYFSLMVSVDKIPIWNLFKKSNAWMLLMFKYCTSIQLTGSWRMILVVCGIKLIVVDPFLWIVPSHCIKLLNGKVNNYIIWTIALFVISRSELNILWGLLLNLKCISYCDWLHYLCDSMFITF